MDFLCYRNLANSTTGQNETLLISDCSYYILKIGFNLFYTNFLILFFIYWKFCIKSRGVKKKLGGSSSVVIDEENKRNTKLFVHHVSIWLLNFALIVTTLLEIAEGIIIILLNKNEISENELISYFKLSSPAIVLLTIILLSIFYHIVECRGEFNYLWVNLIYYIVLDIFEIIRLVSYIEYKDLGIFHVKIFSSILTGIWTGVLTVLLTHALFYHSKRRRRRDFDGGINRDVKYLHYYSVLPSRLTFYWFSSILKLGYSQPLEVEDLGSLPPEEKTKFQLQRFTKKYEFERANADKKKELFSLWKCMFRTIWSSMALGAFFRLGADMSGFIAPLGIRTIVDYVKSNTILSNSTEEFNKNSNKFINDLTLEELLSNGYVMALIILLSTILQSTFSQCSTFIVDSEGIHIKIALQALIYKKSLTLSPTKSSNKRNMTHENSQDFDDDDETNERDFDNGSIVNIMSEDTNNIMMFFRMAHYIWAIPLKLAILMVLLYFQLGYSALIGAALCIISMIPLQYYICKKMALNSKDLMEHSDNRIRCINELVQGMKLLKMFGWELIFSDHLTAIRKKELKNLDRDLLYRSIMTFLTHISSVIVTVVTFGLYPYIETTRLEPSKVFAGLALFNQLTVPLFIFPATVPVVIDGRVSAKRIRDFLLRPEATTYTSNSHSPKIENADNGTSKGGLKKREINKIGRARKLSLGKEIQASSDSVFEPIHEEDEGDEDEDEVIEEEKENLLSVPKELIIEKKISTLNASAPPLLIKTAKNNNTPNSVLTIENGDFSWMETQNQGDGPTLTGISLRVPKGKLIVIVGAIGSGKSSIVSAMLGEMKIISGQVSWANESRIAYASQKPWIQNGTLRDNIIFGKEYKPRRYKKVISACGLQPDIDILREKDFTLIGEKGTKLSGGQKQRIAIARALYHSKANVVILDDPLSALDVEVAHAVFSSGIKNFLLKAGKTVVLVTHHLPVLPDADHIVAMDGGKIRVQGTLEEIRKLEPSLYAEWREIMSEKAAEIEKKSQPKTARERWALVKHVSKVLQCKPKTNQSLASWKYDSEIKPISEHYRKRQLTFSTFRNLSHDMFQLNDDCLDEIMTPILCRRAISRPPKLSRSSHTSVSSKQIPETVASSSPHAKLLRLTSLQVDGVVSETKTKPAKLKRLTSLPATDGLLVVNPSPSINCISQTNEVRERAETLDGSTVARPSFFKRLLSATTRTLSTSGSSNLELEPIPRLVSNVSAVTASESDFPDDEEEANEALLRREGSSDEREYGMIPYRIYWTYICACGSLTTSFYFLFAIGYEAIRVYTNFWLKEWSDSLNSENSTQDYENTMGFYFKIYVVLSFLTVLLSLSSNLVGKRGGGNSREELHRKMLERVVRCPVRFFDTTPIGWIMNRFSSDVAVVDRKLCTSMQRFLQFVFLCLSAVVVNALVNPLFLLVAIPIAGIYYYIQRFYRFSSRELQRIEAISRGPIYSSFHETLEGLSTIRAYKEQARFTDLILEQIDVNNTAAMFSNVGKLWLSISLDYLGSVIVYLATMVSLISSSLYPSVVTPSMVGLAINYTLLVPVYLNWVVKYLAEVEMFMNSVERIHRYTLLETEDYSENAMNADKLPSSWPTDGKVEFRDVSISYYPNGPRIIQNLSLDIAPRSKVGVCGRSGSGKSTLLMSLFKMPPLSGGRIFIDGIDIERIPLLKLRSSLAIIPQENLLFSGSIRFNLDPVGKCSDSQIWRALELAQMKGTIEELQGQLDGEVKDGSGGFSGGQKQLLGIARAILHNSKVVIMDEATSSVDLATERKLLQVVKEAFKDSTVLSIAHRLDTIVDGDRVVVLDAARKVEDGNPSELLKLHNSIFKSMMNYEKEQGNLY